MHTCGAALMGRLGTFDSLVDFVAVFCLAAFIMEASLTLVKVFQMYLRKEEATLPNSDPVEGNP